MPRTPTLTAANTRRPNPNAGRNNLPDPRPLTEYTAVYSEPGGKSRVTVTLSQPCIIRHPVWQFISTGDGASLQADSVTAVGNDTIIFDFNFILSSDIGFIEAPYQDMQVQNFQGGFVRPGGQWFRKAA